MRNRLAVFRSGVSEDRRLFMDLIEGLWEKASTMVSDSPLESCGMEWGALAESSARVLAELAPPGPLDVEAEEPGGAWWEKAARAGFRVAVGEREVHPGGRRGVAALETSYLFSMISGFTESAGRDSVVYQWEDGTPALSGRLPGGGMAVLAASRRGAEAGGLGMIVGMVRGVRGDLFPEVIMEAILPTTADRVLAIRLMC